MIAPAPSKSSIAGRKLPSGQRSPAGITPIARLSAIFRAASATAAAFLKQPVRRGTGPQARERRDPLGDGSISFVPFGTFVRLTGERLNWPPDARRGRARIAPTRSAAARQAS